MNDLYPPKLHHVTREFIVPKEKHNSSVNDRKNNRTSHITNARKDTSPVASIMTLSGRDSVTLLQSQVHRGRMAVWPDGSTKYQTLTQQTAVCFLLPTEKSTLVSHHKTKWLLV